ncbi:ABC transporter permease [Plantibacter sp. YIM 135347]|uniref:ABC transporter permease n=1 Tax=Plantibacter sp. YIM 135347 TaxID=3423919 RepID=UPI003D32E132
MGIFDVAFLVAAVTIAAPILLAATGELVSQRAGVMNVGLEGIMLGGAFGGYLTMVFTGDMLLGFLGGIVAGLLFGALMAVLAIEAKVDQIVAGIALNLLGFGVTAFLNGDFFSKPESFDPLPRVAIPLLSGIPVLGPVVFTQDVFVYAVVVVVVAVGLALNRTTWGIGLKAVGENPIAADAAGVSVRGMRWAAVLFAGACAGAAGAYVSIGDVGVFREAMVGGRGYLALAAVLFGGWRLGGLLVAVAIFAGADALQLRLQASGEVPREVWVVAMLVIAVVLVVGRLRARTASRTAPPRPAELVGIAAVVLAGLLALFQPSLTVPAPLWLALPYVLALAALAASGGAGSGRRRHRAPEALTIPYTRSEA